MKDYAIGYGKTDPKTRWKKGQCGNPMRKRPVKIPSMASMIDDVFAKKVSVREKGVPRRLTAFEVILLRLIPEIGRANKQAIRIRRKYQAYAQAHPTVINVVEDPEKAADEFQQMLNSLPGPTTKEEAEYEEAFGQLTVIEMAEVYRQLLESLNEQDRDDGE